MSRVPSSNPAAEFLVLFVQKLVFIHQCVQLSFEPLDHAGLVSDGSFKFLTTFSNVTLSINCREDLDPEVEGVPITVSGIGWRRSHLCSQRCAQEGNKVTIVSGRSRECLISVLLLRGKSLNMFCGKQHNVPFRSRKLLSCFIPRNAMLAI